MLNKNLLVLKLKERRHSLIRELSVNRSLLLPPRPERLEGQPPPLSEDKEKLTELPDSPSKSLSEPRDRLLQRFNVLRRLLKRERPNSLLLDLQLRRSTKRHLHSKLIR